MSESTSAVPVIRVADLSDITAILCLLLTSFRQFALFDTLYSPLQANLENARDTLFFWRRRLTLDVMDPECDVIVAELPTAELNIRHGSHLEDVDTRKSNEMLKWLNESAGLTQEVGGATSARTVVGFAIWRQRLGDEAARPTGSTMQLGWTHWAQQKWIHAELAFWKKVYTRKDIDVNKYQAYLKAEEEHSETFYKAYEPCYQLDNLATDFRIHRRGIGRLLVQCGLDNAQKLQLDLTTEAGSKGEGLYKRMGFENVGFWKVVLSDSEELVLPILRYQIER